MMGPDEKTFCTEPAEWYRTDRDTPICSTHRKILEAVDRVIESL